MREMLYFVAVWEHIILSSACFNAPSTLPHPFEIKILEGMSDSSNSRRCRKSAPVKNAVFLGASSKGRNRLRDVGNESAS